jgi:hypothetical protein
MMNAVFWDVTRVPLVTDVSEEHIASIIRVTGIGDLLEAICSSETSALRRATWRKRPEDGIHPNVADSRQSPTFRQSRAYLHI